MPVHRTIFAEEVGIREGKKEGGKSESCMMFSMQIIES